MKYYKGILCTVVIVLVFGSLHFYHKNKAEDASLKQKLMEGLLRVSSNIVRSNRFCTSSQSKNLLLDSYQNLGDMLSLLSADEGPAYATAAATSNAKKDVCPEQYTNKKFRGKSFLYWDKGGFRLQNCTDVPEFHTLLTLVYNFVHYDSKYFQHIPSIFHDVNKLYPNIRIIAAIPDTLTLNQADYKDTTIIKLKKSKAESSIWIDLMDRVQTKYVYIGRNVIKFTWFDRLERLVREIGNLEASVVSGAYRTLVSGVWSNGCEQSTLSNYQLVYRHGYDISMEECLVCHHVHGPFVARKSLFHENHLKPLTTAHSMFAEWFLRLKDRRHTVTSCPDAMSFLTDETNLPTEKDQWLGVASALQIEYIHVGGTVLEFSCEEADTGCKNVRAVGKALSTCCIKELSDGVKLVMKKCREGGFLCKLQAGTLLGAVKFNSVLPWELDADIIIHCNNFTAFGAKYKSFFKEQGYKWRLSDGPPSFNLYSASNWKVEIFCDDFMDVEEFIAVGLSPTRIDFDGAYVETVGNPGLHARNRYGHEIYQHVQHWIDIKGSSAAGFYGSAAKTFSKCPTPGHHACLDQYIPDGNLMFNMSKRG